jgi:hypothetical protein
VLLVPSPFLGPVTWVGVAGELRAAGHDVAVSAPEPLAAPPYRPVFVEAAVRAAAGGRVDALVGYSGSGPLLPAIAARLGDVRAAVFVDAALPHLPVPPERLAALRGMAVDGWLPPWHEWFPPSALRDLVPDDGSRARFVAGLRPFPLAYFDEPAELGGPSWPPPVRGYLQLSSAYDAEAAEAHRLGWDVLREESDHLAPLTRPSAVAVAIRELLSS